MIADESDAPEDFGKMIYNKEMKKTRRDSLFCTLIFAFSAVLLGLLAVLCLFNRSLLSMHGGEFSRITRNGGFFIGITVLFLLAVVPGYRLLLRRLPDPKKLFICCLILHFFFGFFLIFNVNTKLSFDAKKIYDGMRAYIARDYSEFRICAYFSNFPNQLGMLTYERILNAYSSNIRFFFMCNLLMTGGIHFFQWKISENLFPNRKGAQVLTILFSFAFLPVLFLSLWVYSDIPGLFFMMGALFCGVKAAFSNEKRYWFPMIVSAVISCLLRQNQLIPWIAFTISAGLFLIRENRKRVLLPLLCVFPLLWISGNIQLNAYRNTTGMPLGNGIPNGLWVARGLQDESEKGINPGWYSDLNWTTHIHNHCDPDGGAQEANKMIAESLEKFRNDPRAASAFFMNKIKTTWCDPTFQSLWYSPLHIEGGVMENPLLCSLRGENGGILYKGTVLGLNVLMVLLFVFGALGCFILCSRMDLKREILLFSVLSFCGVFLFHLIWETKSRYVFSAVYQLIPVAAIGIEGLLKKHCVDDLEGSRGD